jgi:hypothetical protein
VERALRLAADGDACLRDTPGGWRCVRGRRIPATAVDAAYRLGLFEETRLGVRLTQRGREAVADG